jgi:plastocyanin
METTVFNRFLLAAIATLPLVGAGCFSPYSCRDADDAQIISFGGVEVANSMTPAYQTGLQVGDTTTAVSAVADANACSIQSGPKFTSQSKPGRFTWRSSDPLIVTVDANGKLRGIATGRGRITVEVDDAQLAHIDIDVVPPVAQLVIGPATATVRVGDTLRFDAYMADAAGNPIATNLSYPYPVNLSASADQDGDVENWIPGNRQQLLKKFLRAGTYRLRATTVVRNVKLDEAAVITVLP